MPTRDHPIRVLIVDDHGIVRKGTRALLSRVSGIAVVGEARNGEEALQQAAALTPDVILMDLVMPLMDGIEAIRRITAAHPAIHILALTSFATDDKLFPAIKAGAVGYFLKDGEPSDLIAAIRQVARGELSLYPTIAQHVLRELHAPADQTRPPTPDPLTPQEEQVLRCVARGWSNQQVADHLCISDATVRSHVSNLLRKLHLANRVQATLYALRTGLADLDPDTDAPD
jgi:NarL family two-component system response regulator LiaR